MQVEGKSIEECVKEFESIFSNVYGKPEITDFLRQSIASVLLHAKSKMVKESEYIFDEDNAECLEIEEDIDNCYETKGEAFNGGRIEATRDCHAILDEEIAKALV